MLLRYSNLLFCLVLLDSSASSGGDGEFNSYDIVSMSTAGSLMTKENPNKSPNKSPTYMHV